MHEFTVLAGFFAVVAVYMGAFLVWEKLYMEDPPEEESHH